MASEPRFHWNEANRTHIARHGVLPSEVEEVLRRKPAVIAESVRGEELRTVVIGETEEDRLLVIVYTMRGGRVRVVTAYPANRSQRARYQEQKR